MNKATLAKLAANPNYKLSKKQAAEAAALNISLHTQQLQPGDLNLVTFKGSRDASATKSSRKNS